MIIPPNIKAIIFDLDDTLLIDDAADKDAFLITAKVVAEKHDVDANKLAEAAQRISRKVWETSPSRPLTKMLGHCAWEGMWAEYDEGNELFKPISDWQKTFQTLSWTKALEEVGINDKVLAATLGEIYMKERKKMVNLFEGVPELLKKLKTDYKLALLTNGIPKTQWFKIDATGLEPYFDVIVISGEVGIGKPDPKIFDIVLKKLDVDVSEAIMIGNNPDSDIKGAENAGMKSILIEDEKGLRKISEKH